MSGDILFDSLSLDFLELLDAVEINAVFVDNVAVGVGHGDDLCAELSSFFGSVDGNVAGTGDNDGLALEALAVCLQHFICIVADAVAGGFGTCERTAVGEALAGENAVPAASELLVLAEEISDRVHS